MAELMARHMDQMAQIQYLVQYHLRVVDLEQKQMVEHLQAVMVDLVEEVVIVEG